MTTNPPAGDTAGRPPHMGAAIQNIVSPWWDEFAGTQSLSHARVSTLVQEALEHDINPDMLLAAMTVLGREGRELDPPSIQQVIRTLMEPATTDAPQPPVAPVTPYRPQTDPMRPSLPAHLRRGAPERDDFDSSVFDLDEPTTPAASKAGAKAPTTVVPPVPGSPEDFFPCPCSCNRQGGCAYGGFTAITNRVAARSTAVRDTVRCARCVKEKHFGSISREGARTAAKVQVVQQIVDLVDDEEERQTYLATADMQFKASFATWTDKLDPLWQEALTDDSQVLTRIERLRRGVTTRTGLLLVGPQGSGKTWRAYAYARQVLLARLFKPEQVIAGTERAVLGDIDVAGMWGDESRAVKLRRLIDPGVKMYVVDDIGNGDQFISEKRRIALWTNLTDRVYGSKGGATLVLTTNLDAGPYLLDAKGQPAVNAAGQKLPGRFREWVGEAAYSRIVSAMGQPTILVNMVSAETPLGSYRKQVESDREKQNVSDLDANPSSQPGENPPPAPPADSTSDWP